MEPPNYYFNKHIFDFHFHPKSSLVGIAIIDGSCQVLGYDSDNTKVLFESKVSDSSCRALSFNSTGAMLATGSKDGELMLIDVETQQMIALQQQ